MKWFGSFEIKWIFISNLDSKEYENISEKVPS